MHIKIKKLIMNNFLSFGKAELDLTDKGFCLVSGRNNNPRDNALSNGSGKSSWGSAICYALTGQTINGLSKNLKNINVSENSCFVTLLFDIDANSYEVTRYAAPKSDLKIILNDDNEVYFKTINYLCIKDLGTIRYLDGEFYGLVDDSFDKLLEKVEFGKFIFGYDTNLLLRDSIVYK